MNAMSIFFTIFALFPISNSASAEFYGYKYDCKVNQEQKGKIFLREDGFIPFSSYHIDYYVDFDGSGNLQSLGGEQPYLSFEKTSEGDLVSYQTFSYTDFTHYEYTISKPIWQGAENVVGSVSMKHFWSDAVQTYRFQCTKEFANEN